VQQPTGISLSATTIAENQAIGTTVGTFTTTHQNPSATSTYTLVSGEGSTDNAYFTITGNTLKTAASFNFEVKSSYSVRVRTTDSNGLFIERTVTVSVTTVNERPTLVTLSATSFPENVAVGTVVGTLSTTDVDAGDTFTYTFLTGLGTADNAFFTIDGNQLKTGSAFNFEARRSYTIRLRSTDAGGLTTDQAIALGVTDVNEGPTAVTLSNVVSTLVENTSTASRLKVADIAITDDAVGSEVLSVTGSDSSFFEIVGTSLYLKAGVVLDYETQASYSVTIQAADPELPSSTPVTVAYGLVLTNVYETPQVVLSNELATLREDASTSSRRKVADVAVVGDPATSAPVLSSSTFFELDGAVLYLKAGVILDHETAPTLSVSVQSPGNSSATYTLSVTDVNEVPTNIALAPAVVAENLASGTTVGTLSTTDQDVGDTFTYAFATGEGSADNASFTIDGTSVKTAATFDYETKNAYSVRVRSTDSGGLTTEKILSVSIQDTNDGPTALTLSTTSVIENTPAGL
jgi:hypothetical protein